MSRYCWLPTWSTPKNGSLCNLATRRPSESANSSSKAQNRPKCHRLRTGFSTCRKIGAETDLSVSSREEESVEKITVGILFVHVFPAAQHIVEGAAGPFSDDRHGPERSGVAFEVEHPLRGFERDHIVLDGRRLGAVIVRAGGKNASSYKNSN